MRHDVAGNVDLPVPPTVIFTAEDDGFDSRLFPREPRLDVHPGPVGMTTPIDVKVGDELTPLRMPAVGRSTAPTHIGADVGRSEGLDDGFCGGMLSTASSSRLLTVWLSQSKLRSFTAGWGYIKPIHGLLTCRGWVTAIDHGDGTPTLTGTAAVTQEESI